MEDLNAHANLKGKIFKRKMMDPGKLKGLGYFGLAGATYAMFPHLALTFGANFTTFAMAAFSVGGMYRFNDRDIINFIELIADGDNKGKLKLSVSTSPFTSSEVIASVNDVQGVFSLNEDDAGEEDIES